MRVRFIASLLTVMAVPGCGEDRSPERVADSTNTRAESTVVVPISQRQPTALAERDVTRYLAVIEELRRNDLRVQAELEADTLGVVMNEGALAASPAAQRIILRQGFASLEEFHQVAYSIATALNAAAQTSVAELPLPDDPEERKAMEEIRAAMGEFSSDQPPGNVALVAQYRERLVRVKGGER